MSDLVNLSATALARGIRKRSWTAVDVVEAHISRIREVNPALNAVVGPRFAAALEEAERAHARVVNDPPESLPPLLGVPCTVKEFIAVEGMPQTGGIVARAHEVASSDATVVQRLRQAGAIVLGVTNAPEGGLWYETANPVYGRTRNPHDLHRTSGGSSGGEAAIVAAGGAPFGIGSDMGGSVRIPAGFCGIVSHKPTAGLIPSTGHFPPPPDIPHTPLVLGPMARNVEDLELVMDIIAGPDPADPKSMGVDLADPPSADPQRWTVFPVPTNGRWRPAPEVEAAVWKCAKSLEEEGATVAEWKGPDLSRAFEVWAAILATSGQRYDSLVQPTKGFHPLRQAARWLAGRSDHSGAVISIVLLQRLIDLLPTNIQPLVEEAIALRGAMDEALGEHGVLLHPVYPRTATRHRAIALRNPLDAGCTTLFNVSEGPVTVVRVDSDPKGLPIGIQLGAGRGRDRLTLEVGRLLEQRFGAPMPVLPKWGAPAPLGLRLA